VILSLPFLAAAAAQMTPATVPQRPNVTKIDMQASVTIIRAERIAPHPDKGLAHPTDRQYRQRDGLPLIEFY
jgi:hypothetical protein